MVEDVDSSLSIAISCEASFPVESLFRLFKTNNSSNKKARTNEIQLEMDSEADYCSFMEVESEQIVSDKSEKYEELARGRGKQLAQDWSIKL